MRRRRSFQLVVAAGQLGILVVDLVEGVLWTEVDTLDWLASPRLIPLCKCSHRTC
jgi:hypothetical protein